MADSGSVDDARSFFSPKVYDRLKFWAQIILPALGTLIFALGGIWKFEYTVQVVGSITAVDAFLGFILHLSSNAYYKSGANFDGELKMVPKEDGDEKVVFDVQRDPETVIKQMGKHSFEFRVNRDAKN
jgi:hypothetical protein